MWCGQCQADVATEVSQDGQSLLCMACGQPVRKVIAPSLHPETQSAREFLDRWAREHREFGTAAAHSASDAASSPHAVSPESGEAGAIPSDEQREPKREARAPEISAETAEVHPAPAADDAPRSEKPLKKAKLRLDSGHGVPSGPNSGRRDGLRRPRLLQKVESAAEPAATAAPAEPNIPPRRLRVDARQHPAAAPHFDVSRLPQSHLSGPGRTEAVWGQVLAYAGVGLLTIGTALVLWGYFGGLERYSSTGWLVSTAGQMLLLLGIVTLVGGGMQQTTHEVSQRIEHIGGRIIRIEQSTEKILNGPHFRRSRRPSRKSAPAGSQEENDSAP